VYLRCPGLPPLASRLRPTRRHDGKAFVMGTTPGFRTRLTWPRPRRRWSRPVPICWETRCACSRCARRSNGLRQAVAQARAAGSGR